MSKASNIDMAKKILEMNEQRESWCMVEARNNVAWMRPQKRHYVQNQHKSTGEIQTTNQDTGRNSWTDLSSSVHIQRRHFPLKSHAIFG
ncbi:spermatogenesis-associated protein 45 [Macrotis lagotis]|uniref:spermatogenesis-associated protein 45 n=1 Tax=Macrotis lagotis TaxID=92651 RepID=UPI003D69BDA4